MVYCNLWLESKNAVFKRVEVEESQTSDFGSLIVRVIDDRHYRKTHELFSALSKLGKNLA